MATCYSTTKTITTSVQYHIMMLLWLMITTSVNGQSSVDTTTGWNPDDGQTTAASKSWLAQHGRFAFVVVVGVLVLALAIWYIVRSIRGMRRRLKEENENQLHVIKQMSSSHPPQPMYPAMSAQLSDESKSPALQRY